MLFLHWNKYNTCVYTRYTHTSINFSIRKITYIYISPVCLCFKRILKEINTTKRCPIITQMNSKVAFIIKLQTTSTFMFKYLKRRWLSYVIEIFCKAKLKSITRTNILNISIICRLLVFWKDSSKCLPYFHQVLRE